MSNKRVNPFKLKLHLLECEADEKDKKISNLEARLAESKEQLIAMNEKSNKIKKESFYLKQQLAEKDKYTYTGEEVGKIEQNYDNQLSIIEKALELACEHIKEDLKCDDTQDEIYNYFKNKAKEILENE